MYKIRGKAENGQITPLGECIWVINLMLHFFIWLTSQSSLPRLNWLMRRAAGVITTLEKKE